MDEEIKELQDRIAELQRKKKDEEERNKDPFRALRERIARRDIMILLLQGHIDHAVRNSLPTQSNRDGIANQEAENACDTAIITAILRLQEEVDTLRKSLSPARTDWPFLEEIPLSSSS